MSELKATGNQSIYQKKFIPRIVQEWGKKRKKRENRENKLKEESEAMSRLIPLGKEVQNIQFSAKSVSDVDKLLYSSAIMHRAWVFLSGVKLYPDFIDFSAEKRFEGDKGKTIADNLTYIHQFLRRKGGYRKATHDAQLDLIAGEGIIVRHYLKDKNGKPLRMGYSHVPWKEFYPCYDGKSEIRVTYYELDAYVNEYGREMLKRVTLGSIIQPENETNDDKKTEYIGVVHYVNPATLEEYEVHGGNGYVYKELVGDDYPYVDDDGVGFSPYQVRIMYDKLPGEDHAWGVLDMLFDITRLDTVMGNATVNRAIDDADPLKIIYTNDPKEAQVKLRQWEAERRMSGRNRPMFVSNSNIGTQMQAANVGHGNTNANFDYWSNFIIDQATFRTDINFRSLLEFAPTDSQDERRDQLQDKVNLSVINKNAESDKEFALQDMYILRNTNSKFHKTLLNFKRSKSDISAEDNIEDLTADNGELLPIEMTISEYLDKVKDFRYDVAPRLEGAFDDQTIKEVFNMKQDLALLQYGTPAHTKLAVNYFKTVHPRARIEEEDFLPPQPEMPTDLASPEQQII